MNTVKKPLLQIKNLTFGYHKKKNAKSQLTNISLTINKGSWVSILGPNGAGKSTLAKMIVKIDNPKQGEILLNKKPIKQINNKQFARKVAYIPQQIEIPHGTLVSDFVAFGRNPYLGITGTLRIEDKKIIAKAIKATNIENLQHKMLDQLSGGEQQKVLFAMVLAQDAEIILLDEPTTYLDIYNQYQMLEMLAKENERGRTIITILHDINQATQYSDYIYMLKDGQILAEGSPNTTINKQSLQAVYGVKAQFHYHQQRKYISNITLIP